MRVNSIRQLFCILSQIGSGYGKQKSEKQLEMDRSKLVISTVCMLLIYNWEYDMEINENWSWKLIGYGY